LKVDVAPGSFSYSSKRIHMRCVDEVVGIEPSRQRMSPVHPPEDVSGRFGLDAHDLATHRMWMRFELYESSRATSTFKRVKLPA